MGYRKRGSNTLSLRDPYRTGEIVSESTWAIAVKIDGIIIVYKIVTKDLKVDTFRYRLIEVLQIDAS